MIFSNETRINPEAKETAKSIPVIHGQNYYIDEQGYVSTYIKDKVNIYDDVGNPVQAQSIKEITEFIYVINNQLAFKTLDGILVTDLSASKDIYKGGFQGIVGFNETTTEYQYINNNEPPASTITFQGRINSSKQLEILVGSKWVIPLGEFRCYINDTFYVIDYANPLPNSFGDIFTVTLAGWTTKTLSTSTEYIKDVLVQGNTLYLSTRLRIYGSTPFDWSSIEKSIETVIWSEDSRLVGGYFAGDATASYFYIVNQNTSSIYYIDSADFKILQEYHHSQPIMGFGLVDKFLLALSDKEALTVLKSYVSLNTWLIKAQIYFKFNQLSAYEDITTEYTREEIVYSKSINTIIIKSTQRANMMFYLAGDKILSGCHTEQDIYFGDYCCFYVTPTKTYQIKKVEENGDYTELDVEAGKLSYDSWIYIGSDLEPDVGGSTLRDTEIIFEGKIAISDGEDTSIESSSDVPQSKDLPVRTFQVNPDNEWFLYTKTLRYPVSYTDWLKISMMPTTKIFNIRLVEPLVKES